VTPEFSKEETFRFFSDTYSSTPKEFEKPDWMPTMPPHFGPFWSTLCGYGMLVAFSAIQNGW